MTMRLSVVIPTYNERDNIALLLQQLIKTLESSVDKYEIIVVDDQSPDGTAEKVRQFSGNTAVRLLQRSQQRGLASALADGFDAAQGEYILAMDADGQHNPSAVATLLRIAQSQSADVVVATRYADGGCVRGWSWYRAALSRCAARSVQPFLPVSVSDPLSGFFLLRRQAWVNIRLMIKPAGFKLLLDILLTEPTLRCEEYGYCFLARKHGKSKLGIKPIVVFLSLLWRLIIKKP